MKEDKNYFKGLLAVDVSKHIKKKGQFSYLSWAIAWNYIKSEYPDAQRTVYEAPETGLNWFSDGITAYVKVGITVNGVEHIDYLPVKDYRHNSITVDKMTTMDVNTAIQRSTAKAIAMHGLGLSIFANEDTLVIPEENAPIIEKKDLIKKTTTKKALVVGDANWKKVLVFMTAHKEDGFDFLINQFSKKYKISVKLSNELKKIFES
tara:strand:- start:4848 stop:5465 length:618 start_codon:yes stop_codon:yes gene_type:complete